jgi:hypothetical protein
MKKLVVDMYLIYMGSDIAEFNVIWFLKSVCVTIGEDKYDTDEIYVGQEFVINGLCLCIVNTCQLLLFKRKLLFLSYSYICKIVEIVFYVSKHFFSY